MSEFVNEIPMDEQGFRTQLYKGVLFHLPASPPSLNLVETCEKMLGQALGDQPRQAQFQLDDDSFYHRIGQVRKQLYTEPQLQKSVFEIMAHYRFDPHAHVIDPARLRVVRHLGHENPAAAPVYYTHRDTWYANPQAQITWWIPVHDVEFEETFEFYPEYFGRAVNNSSEIFEYQEWVRKDWNKKIGWQSKKSDREARYPQLTQEIEPKDVVRVKARRGELIIFAGAHLHRTIRQVTGQTRFSLDFRSVHCRDHLNGVGPINVDDRSKGSNFRDHIALRDIERQEQEAAI